MGMCKIFFKDATIIKMQNGRQRAAPKNFVCSKTLKLKIKKIIQILRSHSPLYRDVLVIYLKVLLKFKMAAMD